MQYPQPLVQGRLIRRYKRFLADVVLDDGEDVTAHCPNTGAMLGCQEPGSRVWLSRSGSASRKYPYTWELVETGCGVLVGIHTGRTNALVAEALAAGVIGELDGYAAVRREVRVAGSGSRLDFRLDDGPGPPCYLEVKNVTAAVDAGMALFPDAVSTRAARHVEDLAALVDAGFRAVLCFCVQREDVREVRPADAIDPAYGEALRRAAANGVEVLAYRCRVGPEEVVLTDPVPVVLGPGPGG
jgi:sugar fermentation stimulation protein A